MSCFGDQCDLKDEELSKLPECPECGAKVDDEGDAVTGCSYSPIDCEKCGCRPCDGSC